MTNEIPAKWQSFEYFLGSWEGHGSGGPGESTVRRSYRLVLDRAFIMVDNRSDYPPQEKNPEGEIHEDLALLSFDEGRQTYVLREFHVEGYVNQYTLNEIENGSRLVFETESLENLPVGWRARTTYEILDADHFREIFDLARPGKEYACMITIDLERVGD